MLAASIVRRLALREPLIVRREPVVDAAGLRGAGGGAFDRLVRRLGAVRSGAPAFREALTLALACQLSEGMRGSAGGGAQRE